MATSCTTCAHPRLADIHRTLDAGEGINATARTFGLSPSTLKLHLRHRVKAEEPAEVELDAPAEEKVPDQDLPLDDLPGRMVQCARTADELRKVVLTDRFAPTADRLRAMAEYRRTVESMGKLEHALRKQRETDILQSPEFMAFRDLVLKAVAPFDDASAALLLALRVEEHA